MNEHHDGGSPDEAGSGPSSPPPSRPKPALDPAMLASIAALSHMDEEELSDFQPADQQAESSTTAQNRPSREVPETDFTSLIPGGIRLGSGSGLTREQVAEIVQHLDGVASGADRDGRGESTAAEGPDVEMDGDGEEEIGDEEDSGGDDQTATPEPGQPPAKETAAQKRKRNRLTLSCTECHRRKRENHCSSRVDILTIILFSQLTEQCDRNLPCGRCVRRNIPHKCRMDEAIMPVGRKGKRRREAAPAYGIDVASRVAALENVLRRNGAVDPEESSAAIHDIIRASVVHAGQQQDAAHALAQLTQLLAMGGPVSGGGDTQGALLLNVLQHLSSTGGKPNGEGETSTGSAVNGVLSDTIGYGKARDVWSNVPMASYETTVQVQAAYDEDDTPVKHNIGLSGFREDSGRLFVPPSVRQVERALLAKPSNLSEEPLPVEGYQPFLDAGAQFAYGDNVWAYKKEHICSIQTVSITGAIRLGAQFLSRFAPSDQARVVSIPNPTTEEDAIALRDAGFEIRLFRFFDRRTGMVDWDGMRDDLYEAPMKSVVLLQLGGSQPTGAEPSDAQWRLLAEIVKERQLIPFFVLAFQGLSSGNVEKDAQPLRYMVHLGLPVVLAQSFDASMGLHSDSPSILSVVSNSGDERESINSQLRAIARAILAHPPAWGARIAYGVLSDARLKHAWQGELRAMTARLSHVRMRLHDLIANKLKTPGNWNFFKKAQGMYCTTLLTPRQLHLLTAKHHFHLLPDGCFSLGCLNSQKLDLLARAIDAVVRESLVQEEEEEEEALLEEAESDAAHNDLQQRLEAAAKAAAEAEAEAAAEATIEVTPDLAEEVDDLQERLAAAAKAAAAAEASAAAAAVVAATRHSSEETQTGHQITEEDFDMLDADGESLDGNGMVRQKTNSNYDGDEPPGAPETDFSGLAEMAMRSAQNMAGDEQENEDESEEAQRVARAQLLQLMT